MTQPTDTVVAEFVVDGKELAAGRRHRFLWTLWLVALVSFALTALAMIALSAWGISIAHMRFWIGFCFGGIAAAISGVWQQWRMDRRLAQMPPHCFVVFTTFETYGSRVFIFVWTTALCSIMGGQFARLLFVPGMNVLAGLAFAAGLLLLWVGRRYYLFNRKHQTVELHEHWLYWVAWRADACSTADFIGVTVSFEKGNDGPGSYPIKLTAPPPARNYDLLRLESEENAFAVAERIARYLHLPVVSDFERAKGANASLEEELI